MRYLFDPVFLCICFSLQEVVSITATRVSEVRNAPVSSRPTEHETLQADWSTFLFFFFLFLSFFSVSSRRRPTRPRQEAIDSRGRDAGGRGGVGGVGGVGGRFRRRVRRRAEVGAGALALGALVGRRRRRAVAPGPTRDGAPRRRRRRRRPISRLSARVGAPFDVDSADRHHLGHRNTNVLNLKYTFVANDHLRSFFFHNKKKNTPKVESH